MPRNRALTHARIVDTAYESFWRAGYTRTNVDGIAARAGVTKRTLYAHFRSKDDLLAAVLRHYAGLAQARLGRIGARLPAGRQAMAEGLFADLSRWAASMPRWTGSGLTRLVMELADLPGHPARALARRSKATTEGWIAGELAGRRVAKSRERAREVMLLMEGAMVLTVIHGDRGYFEAAGRAARRLIRGR